MLFILDTNPEKTSLQKTTNIQLKDIEWKEENLQTLIYDNIAQIFPEEDLLLISQSIRGQEAPDLMAIDKEGNLNIFELKAWESKDLNLLQALRYGQIYGQFKYDALNEMYKKFNPSANSLLQSVNNKFSIKLSEDQINTTQHFIIITNGLDHKTRKAIKYWSGLGLSVQGWIYRLHHINETYLIEFDRFKVNDNPIEDLQGGYYILNTNIQSGDIDEREMLEHSKAAAYFDPWKNKIKNLSKGDTVFLYRSGKGIIAMGIATGDVKVKNYRDEEKYQNEEYYQKLNNFMILKKPITASDIKQIGKSNFVFMQTLFALDSETGNALWKRGYEIDNNS